MFYTLTETSRRLFPPGFYLDASPLRVFFSFPRIEKNRIRIVFKPSSHERYINVYRNFMIFSVFDGSRAHITHASVHPIESPRWHLSLCGQDCMHTYKYKTALNFAAFSNQSALYRNSVESSLLVLVLLEYVLCCS